MCIRDRDEVVVIGYGTQKLSDISGAVSTISGGAIETSSPVRVEDALQGQASGINIISSGSPGSKPTVLIRGITSYAGNDPLVIIDGVSAVIDDLNALNPNDISSVNILKDAALASIYGVKGGSGVIVITTKSGKKNTKTSFSFNTSIGTQQVVKTIYFMNATEYAAILNEASVAGGEGIIFSDISSLGIGTDWQNQVLVDAPIVNHSISASGGSENTSYYVSAAYLGQDGVVGGGHHSFFNRTNFTTNLDTDLNDKTRLLVLINPNNPTGSFVEKSDIDVLAEGLKKHPHVTILSDEIYSRQIFDGKEMPTFFNYPELRERLIVLEGWSKAYSMTGWRLGWSFWPKNLVEHVNKLLINSVSCVNAAAQFAGIAALDGPDAVSYTHLTLPTKA